MEDIKNELLKKATNEGVIYILPLRYNNKTKESLFSESSIEFYKYTIEQNKQIEFIEKEPKLIALHDSSIWMPILFIAESIMLPLVIDLVSNFLCDKLGKQNKLKTEVNLKIKVKSKEKIKTLEYKGSVDNFEKIFKKIDVNKFLDEDKNDWWISI